MTTRRRSVRLVDLLIMDLRKKAALVLGGAVVGSVLGGGIMWTSMGSLHDDDEPVRVVRSPCNLAAQTRLDALLPGARISAEYADSSEPGAEGYVGGKCVFAPPGDTGRQVSVQVRRYGPVTHTRPRTEGGRTVTTTALQAARRAFDGAIADADVRCAARPVPGVGERAAACAGTTRWDEPVYLVVARAGTVVVTVLDLHPGTGREAAARLLAANVLEAA